MKFNVRLQHTSFKDTLLLKLQVKYRKVSKFNAEETKIWTTQLRTLQSFQHGHQLNVTDF